MTARMIGSQPPQTPAHAPMHDSLVAGLQAYEDPALTAALRGLRVWDAGGADGAVLAHEQRQMEHDATQHIERLVGGFVNQLPPASNGEGRHGGRSFPLVRGRGMHDGSEIQAVAEVAQAIRSNVLWVGAWAQSDSGSRDERARFVEPYFVVGRREADGGKRVEMLLCQAAVDVDGHTYAEHREGRPGATGLAPRASHYGGGRFRTLSLSRREAAALDQHFEAEASRSIGDAMGEVSEASVGNKGFAIDLASDGALEVLFDDQMPKHQLAMRALGSIRRLASRVRGSRAVVASRGLSSPAPRDVSRGAGEPQGVEVGPQEYDSFDISSHLVRLAKVFRAEGHLMDLVNADSVPVGNSSGHTLAVQEARHLREQQAVGIPH